MPHLRFRAVSNDHIEKLSKSLPESLAPIMETSEDNFTFEVVPSQFFANGSPVAGTPFVEVLWFKRPQEIQDQSAELITQALKVFFPHGDITVVFMELLPPCYYENGKHF